MDELTKLKELANSILQGDPELLLLFNVKFDAVQSFTRHVRTLIALGCLTEENFRREVSACVSEYNRRWTALRISSEVIHKFNNIHNNNEKDWFERVSEKLDDLSLNYWDFELLRLMRRTTADFISLFIDRILKSLESDTKELMDGEWEWEETTL